MYNIADPELTGCIKYSQAEFTISVFLGETIPDLRIATEIAFKVACGEKRGPDATIEFDEYFVFLVSHSFFKINTIRGHNYFSNSNELLSSET